MKALWLGELANHPWGLWVWEGGGVCDRTRQGWLGDATDLLQLLERHTSDLPFCHWRGREYRVLCAPKTHTYLLLRDDFITSEVRDLLTFVDPATAKSMLTELDTICLAEPNHHQE